MGNFPELKFRNFVTLIVIAGLIGGSGTAVIVDSFANPQVLVSEVIDTDGKITKTYKDNSLQSNQSFTTWMGAIIGFGGIIVAFLYKAKSGNGDD